MRFPMTGLGAMDSAFFGGGIRWFERERVSVGTGYS